MLMKNMPASIKRSIELLGLCALGLIVIVGQSVLMPLLMAFFISLLMLPPFRWLRRRRVPEVISIILCIMVFLIIIIGIITFLTYQIGGFVSDIDLVRQNLSAHWNKTSSWITAQTNMTLVQQIEMLKEQSARAGQNIAGLLQGAVISLSGIFIFVGLLPIYVFLILFYRRLLVKFVYMWFREDRHPKLSEVISETESIVKYYLFGLIIQITYLTILLGGILLLFGIKHAILIGVVFAILNLIPYLGAFIGNLIAVLLTLATSQEIWQIWAVLATIVFVQFLDNNILMPRIVGAKVKINALASIVGIFIGGAMLGISGMFLSLPVMAVLKIIFERSAGFRQWGMLLGDTRVKKTAITGSGCKNTAEITI